MVLSGVFNTFASDSEFRGRPFPPCHPTPFPFARCRTVVLIAHAEQSTTFSLFPIVESIRYCTLDSTGYISRPLAQVLDDRSNFRRLVDDLHTNLRSLQGLVSTGTDPSGLASTRAVTVANFDNAQIVRAGISILETDLAVQVGAAGIDGLGSACNAAYLPLNACSALWATVALAQHLYWAPSALTAPTCCLRRTLSRYGMLVFFRPDVYRR